MLNTLFWIEHLGLKRTQFMKYANNYAIKEKRQKLSRIRTFSKRLKPVNFNFKRKYSATKNVFKNLKRFENIIINLTNEKINVQKIKNILKGASRRLTSAFPLDECRSNVYHYTTSWSTFHPLLSIVERGSYKFFKLGICSYQFY